MSGWSVTQGGTSVTEQADSSTIYDESGQPKMVAAKMSELPISVGMAMAIEVIIAESIM